MNPNKSHSFGVTRNQNKVYLSYGQKMVGTRMSLKLDTVGEKGLIIFPADFELERIRNS